jgi:hypothetical protein
MALSSCRAWKPATGYLALSAMLSGPVLCFQEREPPLSVPKTPYEYLAVSPGDENADTLAPRSQVRLTSNQKEDAPPAEELTQCVTMLEPDELWTPWAWATMWIIVSLAVRVCGCWRTLGDAYRKSPLPCTKICPTL